MNVFHNSQDVLYRSPFGAVPTESEVSLRLDIASDVSPDSVFLKVLSNDDCTLVPMQSRYLDNTHIYTATIKTPHTPCLLRYGFVINLNGQTYYYSNTSGKGGIGDIAHTDDFPLYQITAYDKSFCVPDWFAGRIMYQIFPDRFWGEGEITKKRDEYIIHYDRHEMFSFNRHPFEDGPAYNDFYGGNLKGIIKKLPYIKSLGVGVIYLNPIFDAYSNHKYDTADYKKIDPMFGSEDDFVALCREAKKLDINIILDGVFSHTGADSIYFNKYKSYGSGGAYNDPLSPYRNWYKIDNWGNYESWWGCSNLPNVNEMDPSYLDYVLLDEDSVIKKWLRLGAAGWRLDVADELPDEFIKILREEVKKVKADAVIIGEVWEDASNKVAYGLKREYLLGHELDSVMNYPFRDSITAFLMGHIDAEEMNSTLMSIMENYPREVFYSLMNHIGTHDTMRIKSLFGELPEDCKDAKLPWGMESLATYRLMCAAFMQMTYPGVPSIYYGDEVGLQGGKDPYNRAPFPWRNIDFGLLEHYQKLGELRNSIAALRRGKYKTLYANGDVFIFARYFEDGKDAFGNAGDGSFAICAINRSFEDKKILLDVSEFDFDTLCAGIEEAEAVSTCKNSIEVLIKPIKCNIVYSKGRC